MTEIQLRGVSLDDATAITQLLAGDTELALQTATIPIPYTIESATAFLRDADPEQIFAITVNGLLVGMIGMLPGSDPVEIGCRIGWPFWGARLCV